MSFHLVSLKSNFLSAFDASNHTLHLTHTMLCFFCSTYWNSFHLNWRKQENQQQWTCSDACLHLFASIDRQYTYSLIHSEYLSLFMFNFMLLLAPTQTYTLGQSQTQDTHPTIHKIIQSIRMTTLCICAYNGIRRHTRIAQRTHQLQMQ